MLIMEQCWTPYVEMVNNLELEYLVEVGVEKKKCLSLPCRMAFTS